MEPSSLALRFNEVSGALQPLGHRIVVRRARELLGQGRFDDSVTFLSEAARRLSVRELTGLANDVRAWVHARGDIEALLGEHDWIVGSELDDLIATEISEYSEIVEAGSISSELSQRELRATAPVKPRVTAGLIPPPIPDDTVQLAAESTRVESAVVPTTEIVIPEVIPSHANSGLPTGPLVAGIIMLQILVIWFTLFWPY